MNTHRQPEPTALVIFGAGGDLAHRKLLPAIYNLFLDHFLPEHFAVIGVDRVQMSDDAFRQHMRQGVDQFSRQGKSRDEQWLAFAQRLSFLQADFSEPGCFDPLVERLLLKDKEWSTAANRIFYLATPPTVIGLITQRLDQSRLTGDRQRARVVVEKPFGQDLASAKALNQTLSKVLAESQVYRIDHYLGKETVQNILAFRFANSLFEPIWNRRYIDQVQISVAETVGVEQRGGYYDRSGALRDMVQSHLMQVLCYVTMEPPVSFDADEIRNKKADVLRAIRPIPAERVDQFAVRGQYGTGTVNGQKEPAYRAEPNVNPKSATETYAALKLFVDNWRWQDVPFYLRTGKKLPARVSSVSIQFKPVPHRSFPATAAPSWMPNRLVLRIQPDEGIHLFFQAKEPGPTFTLRPVDMHFSYQEDFAAPAPEAYETLLLDVIRADATLFMRADQVETAWSIVTPMLDYWQAVPPVEFPNYAAGSWGPAAADALLAADGRMWFPPLHLEKHT